MLPIRRLLMRDLLVLMAGLSALILGLAWWSQHLALGRQAEARSRTALRQLDEVLRLDLTSAQSLGQAVHQWWLDGTLDPARPDEAARLVLPVLAAQRSITSLNLAREDGRSLLFLRLGEAWSMRELQDAGPAARVRWHRLGRPGLPALPEAWTPMDYDPRTRPWYRTGAVAEGPLWTEPYLFYTTRDPGITCALPVRDEAGLKGVVALDFLLDDLTARVWSAQPTPRSRCLVVDGQGRTLILPNEPAYRSAEARRSAFMKPLGLELPAPQWVGLLGTGASDQVIRARQEGETVLGLAWAFHGPPGIHWQLLLAVPEDELLGPARVRLWALLALAGLALGLAVWRIQRIAHRFAAPISQLSAAAEALGQGHSFPPVPSGIAELGSLDRALRKAGESLAEQARLQRQLEHSQRIETVGTLAGGIAHDVNNQLAAILGQLHLCRELLPEGHPVLTRLQRAEEATKRCAQTTRALLSFSHQSRPELKPLDLNHLVGDTATILDRLLGGRIRLNLELASDLPLVAGDPIQLEQVLMNLAINARDAMPQGGHLTLQTSRQDPGRVGLEVRDTGPGIPADILPRIFEPFITTKEIGKGTGLGLAMVFGILKAHGGRIEADNPAEGGARFRISLPAAEVGLVAGAGPQVDLGPGGKHVVGRRILLVEDEAPLRDLLADALTLARAQVTAAPDGAVAWRAWQSGPFDLVLSDQRMPDCTGLELLARIRLQGSAVPFVLMSGQSLEEASDLLARDPRVRLLQKPFELPRMLTTLDELLGPREASLG